MEAGNTQKKASSLRWGILRQALLPRLPPQADSRSQTDIERISRRTQRGFNLIPFQLADDRVPEHSGALSNPQCSDDHSRDACLCYTLPIDGAPRLYLTQRVNNRADLGDFEICNAHNVDNTGLVCSWPSEDVLAYFCLLHVDMFRSKRVIELGSGYGLAGLVIAATTEALEVVISDGNPQVVNYIQRNIDANSQAFGDTKVKCMKLHWNQEEISMMPNTFDVIVASDCSFFKEFHQGLSQTVKFLLKNEGPSEAIFFSPKRGDSLDKFLEEIKKIGLHFSVTENYHAEVWKCHQAFMTGDDDSWPGYEKDHCYPLLVRITQ